ncbi:hypothetical protein NEOLI_003593 [Neolecta irregularis DAH-3]|uniref:Uncharacterized protein n=1 Tax=Neolecta irregularis (strain DAH-3) TaxID=1198029 RepID=A0A1U7LQB7_NEOID|nr:hypothetical protein NEOLI_003593 [Neolecta irregularis DAH-3]|eukprot:OLL24742.1 hypothetical protein NEOLI_003593 [Neolecta irregularis DAH-3]
MQTAVRAKPSLVNVKASPSLATVPPVPKMPPLPDLGFEERSRFSLGSVLRASRDIKLDIPSPAVFGLGLHSGPQSSTSRDDQTHSPFSDNQSSTFTFPAPPNSSPFADEHRISASDSKQEP